MADETEIEAHGVTVTITTSAGTDGAPVVFIDTDEDLEGNIGSPGPKIRVHLNDADLYIGVPHVMAEEDPCSTT